jgi:hypothetical protein
VKKSSTITYDDLDRADWVYTYAKKHKIKNWDNIPKKHFDAIWAAKTPEEAKKVKKAYYIWQDPRGKSLAKKHGLTYLQSGGDEHVFRHPKTKKIHYLHTDAKASDKPNQVMVEDKYPFSNSAGKTFNSEAEMLKYYYGIGENDRAYSEDELWEEARQAKTTKQANYSKAFERGFIKAANSLQLQNQNYMPIAQKRQLSPEEQMQIEAAKQKILPKIFTSLKDPMTAKMFSPWTTGSLGALLGAGAGGLGGAMIAPKDNEGLGASLGALLGGGLGGVVGYKSRDAANSDLEEMISRSPEKATLRDYYSDPLYQADQDRNLQTRNMMLLAKALKLKINLHTTRS